MRVSQITWNKSAGWQSANVDPDSQLVYVFGGIDVLKDPQRYEELRKIFPSAEIVMGTTAGEITRDQVRDESVVATGMHFSSTQIRTCKVQVADHEDSFTCGREITRNLSGPGLKHIFIVSDGILVNGDELIRGVNQELPAEVLITGGLAADAGRFSGTLTGLNQAPVSGQVVAVGFYGSSFMAGHGSRGGWDIFGPVRIVTRSSGNKLFELDGTNALELYKKYLGDKAAELPGAALLFPLCILSDDGSHLVRTILNIDESSGSMTFAGDIPQGARVQFMMANFDRLIDGAFRAAEEGRLSLKNQTPDLVLMISCVGRKIVLDQRVEEEVESVSEIFGSHPVYAGFYSNGEISPLASSTACSLHNQTMTITTYQEIAQS
ncbi:MAG: hypothetical protein RL220_170 [Bacteroidota bacterium]